MFKGLRTKIENERTGQGNTKNLHEPRTTDNNSSSSSYQIGAQSTSSGIINDEFIQETLNKPTINNQPIKEAAKNDDKSPILGHADSQLSKVGDQFQQILKLSDQESSDQLEQNGEDFRKTLGELKSEIFNLSNQLRSVIKERDESNDQNAQLYQLIEKLRRSLEEEKEVNSSLQTKLHETELALKERDKSMESFKNRSLAKKSIKSLDQSNSNESLADDIDGLKLKVNELQNQMSEKNRQLRIRQQNLNDIKKALQKEMAEHNKTQEELIKIQNQIKQQHVQIKNNSSHNDCSNLQNGSAHSDTNEIPKNPSLSDKNQDVIIQAVQDGGEEAAGISTSNLQLDRMSCLSRSSASVDDFDSNDLQQGSCNKEVNQEYLRNVLFRYMTSNDTETTQHLVKALIVLMNFTPEQSACIKSAMKAKSNWLRLK